MKCASARTEAHSHRQLEAEEGEKENSLFLFLIICYCCFGHLKETTAAALATASHHDHHHLKKATEADKQNLTTKTVSQFFSVVVSCVNIHTLIARAFHSLKIDMR